jgi:hypothetical protein
MSGTVSCVMQTPERGGEREGRGEGVRERKRECVYARASERV